MRSFVWSYSQSGTNGSVMNEQHTGADFESSVALVTLFADSLHSVEPSYSVTFYKIIGLLMYV